MGTSSRLISKNSGGQGNLLERRAAFALKKWIQMVVSLQISGNIWKRFVVDAVIDCRINYGFTSTRKFRDSMKIQGFNYKNIPVIEEARDRSKLVKI